MRLIIFIALLLVTADSLAFRCGTHLIREGDHYLEVLKNCGEPDLQERWVEESVISRRIHPSFKFRELTTGGVVVRLWTYNLGAQKFMRQLRFRDGFLERIEKIDYGFSR